MMHRRGATGSSRAATPRAMASRGRGGRRTRRAVVVQANLFSRVSRVFRSYANSIVSSLEDPEKVLDQSLLDMQNDYAKMRQATAQVIASRKQLEVKYENAATMADEWKQRAKLALEKGNDELARQALSKRKVFEETATGLREQLALQQSSVDKLIEDTRTLEAKIQDAKTKKDTLKARAQAAKTTSKVTGVVGSIDTSNALSAFEKMEEKVLRLEAEADAISTMSEVDKLTDEFKQLKGADDIDAELEAMRREIEGPKAPKGELPPGRPVDDAIEKELNDMK